MKESVIVKEALIPKMVVPQVRWMIISTCTLVCRCNYKEILAEGLVITEKNSTFLSLW